MSQLPALYTRSTVGHRGAYLDFAANLLHGISRGRFGALVTMRPVLFLMADDLFVHYAITAVCRVLLGRRTAGLLFRPSPALVGANRVQRLKRFLLRFLKRLPQVRTLSIVPMPLDPRFDKIVDGWIYDFQLWDMTDADFENFARLRLEKTMDDAGAEAFSIRIRQQAAGRKVLVALGVQSRGKGFARLADAALALAQQGWFVVSAGKVAPDMQEQKAALGATGALIEDRFVSDGELLAAYAAADAVWCTYDPAYDQASGILGRAVQFGCPAVVRAGSYSEALCRMENLAHLAISGEMGAPVDLSTLPQADPEGGRAAAARFRRHSVSVLSEALGIAPVEAGNG